MSRRFQASAVARDCVALSPTARPLGASALPLVLARSLGRVRPRVSAQRFSKRVVPTAGARLESICRHKRTPLEEFFPTLWLVQLLRPTPVRRPVGDAGRGRNESARPRAPRRRKSGGCLALAIAERPHATRDPRIRTIVRSLIQEATSAVRQKAWRPTWPLDPTDAAVPEPRTRPGAAVPGARTPKEEGRALTPCVRATDRVRHLPVVAPSRRSSNTVVRRAGAAKRVHCRFSMTARHPVGPIETPRPRPMEERSMSFYRGMTLRERDHQRRQRNTDNGLRGQAIWSWPLSGASCLSTISPGLERVLHRDDASVRASRPSRRSAPTSTSARSGGSDGNPDDVAAKVRAEGGIADSQVVGDTEAAVKWIRAQPDHNGKVGLIGFLLGRPARLHLCLPTEGHRCLRRTMGGPRGDGARRKLNAKTPVAPIDMTKDLEGQLPPARPVRQRRPRTSSPEQVNQHEAELKKHGKAYEFQRYDGAGHGFFYWHRPLYRPEQAMDGWSKIFAFFGKYLTK